MRANYRLLKSWNISLHSGQKEVREKQKLEGRRSVAGWGPLEQGQLRGLPEMESQVGGGQEHEVTRSHCDALEQGQGLARQAKKVDSRPVARTGAQQREARQKGYGSSPAPSSWPLSPGPSHGWYSSKDPPHSHLLPGIRLIWSVASLLSPPGSLGFLLPSCTRIGSSPSILHPCLTCLSSPCVLST